MLGQQLCNHFCQILLSIFIVNIGQYIHIYMCKYIIYCVANTDTIDLMLFY